MNLKKKFIRLKPHERLYQFDKPIVALTGGIATGKSTVTKILEEKGLTIIDADQLVKAIYQQDESKKFIQHQFPEVWVDDGIDFKKLRELFFSDAVTKTKVEKFIYERLPAAFKTASLKASGQDFYIYDVPLLFERSLQSKVDLIVLTYAPRELQLARLMERDKTEENIGNQILDQQMSIEDKKMKSDVVLDNTGSKKELAAEVEKLLLQIME
jgi:dephospho-CoA kinase